MQSELHSFSPFLNPPRRWHTPDQSQPRIAKGSHEVALKALIAALFLPEGLSFFIGDFRFSVARALIIILTLQATLSYFRRFDKTHFVPSDLFALAAGLWMIIAPTVVQGPSSGLKSGGILALEFTGSYWIFRHLLGSVDGAVRVTSFAIRMTFVIVFLAVLDPLTGTLFTYEFVKSLTGYSIPAYDWALAVQADSVSRDGIIRAMGPLEHSILFGAVCAWLGTLALCTFPSRLIGWSVAAAALVGIIASQARGPLLVYVVSLGLIAYYYVTSGFHARWKLLGTAVSLAVAFLVVFSSNPIGTLLGFGVISPEAGWYRQAIWENAVPLVLQSPVFGAGFAEWNWQASGVLVGDSVDALWLKLAMTLGIPGSILVLLTMISPFWAGSLDRAQHLSRDERRLSVALGITTVAAVFLGFAVDYWGSCWILLGVFAGVRANLVQARASRRRAAHSGRTSVGATAFPARKTRMTSFLSSS